MKKIIVGFFSFILLTLLIILAFNMNIKNMFNDIISNSGVDKQVNNAISNYFNKDTINLINKDEISGIVDELMDETIENDGDSEFNDVLVDVINKNREKLNNYGIDDEKIDSAIYDIEANITASNNNFKLSDEQKMGLIFYKIVSSNKIRKYLIISICSCIIILLIINKFSSLKDIGISCISASVLIKGSCILLDNTIHSNDSLKNFRNINYYYMDKYVYIYVIIGVVLIMNYFIYKLFYKKGKD